MIESGNNQHNLHVLFHRLHEAQESEDPEDAINDLITTEEYLCALKMAMKIWRVYPELVAACEEALEDIQLGIISNTVKMLESVIAKVKDETEEKNASD